ncbi:MAG: cation-transporting P-type ATPase, partial [Trinickia sp.]|uniref:cation-transporting P-type ATPase n=1 Tax=Trinickia sp. TaxID=2571163 RepID=UPI003F7F34EE
MPADRVESVPDVVSGYVEPASPAGDADKTRGLTSARVEQLRARFGRNVVDSTLRRTWWRTLGEVLREPMF